MQEQLFDSTLSERPSSNVLDPPRNEREPGSQRSSGAGSWQQATEELYSEDGHGKWETADEHTPGKPPAAAPAMPEGGSLTGPSQEESYTANDEEAGPHPPPLAQAPSLGDSSSSYAMSFSGSGDDSDEEEGPGEQSLAAQAAALEDSYTSEPQPSLPQQASNESYADQEGGEGARPVVDEEGASSSSSSSTSGSAREPHPPRIPHPLPPHIPHPLPPPTASPAGSSASAGHRSPDSHPARQGPLGPHTDQEDGALDNQDVAAAAAAAHAQTCLPPTQQTPSGLRENNEGKCGDWQDPGLASAPTAAHVQPHASEARQSPNLLNMNPEEGRGGVDQDSAVEVGAREQPPNSPFEQEGPPASRTSADEDTNQGAAAAAAELDPFPLPPVPHPESSRSSAEGERDRDADPGAAAVPAGDSPPFLAHQASGRLYDAEDVGGHVSHGATAARAGTADGDKPADAPGAAASSTHRAPQAPFPTQQEGLECFISPATDATNTGLCPASQPRSSGGSSQAPRTTEPQSQGAPHRPDAMSGSVPSPQQAPDARSHSSSGSYSEDEWEQQQQQQQLQRAPPTSSPHPTTPAPDPPSHRASSGAYSMDDFTKSNQQQLLQQQPPAPAQQASPFAAAAAASQHKQEQQQQQQQQQPLLWRRRQGRPTVPFIRDMPPPSSASKHKPPAPGSVSSTSPQPGALSIPPSTSLEGARFPKPKAAPSRPHNGSADLHHGQHKTSSPRSSFQAGLPTLSMTTPPLPSPISKSPQYSPTAYWPPPACCMPPPPPAAPRPPRARHSLQHVDPAYLQAPMTTAPWGGKLYNWEAHHNQNLNLLRTRQREAHAARVQEAMKTEAGIQQQSQERFQAWLRRKRDEREEQIYEVNHLTHPSHPNWSPLKRDPPEVLAAREQEWKPPTPFDQDAWRVIQRVKHMKRPGTVANL